MEIRLADAIKSLAGSTTAFEITDGLITNWDYAEVQTNVAQPTAEALATELTRLQAEYDSKQYARDRATAYAALNQLEMQFDDQVNGTTTWVDAINDIKTKYPKP